MKVKLIGIKKVSGVSKATGKEFSFSTANMISEFSARDIDKGAVGSDVHTCTIPERLIGVITPDNIGKEFDVDFYFTQRGECLGYAAPIK